MKRFCSNTQFVMCFHCHFTSVDEVYRTIRVRSNVIFDSFTNWVNDMKFVLHECADGQRHRVQWSHRREYSPQECMEGASYHPRQMLNATESQSSTCRCRLIFPLWSRKVRRSGECASMYRRYEAHSESDSRLIRLDVSASVEEVYAVHAEFKTGNPRNICNGILQQSLYDEIFGRQPPQQISQVLSVNPSQEISQAMSVNTLPASSVEPMNRRSTMLIDPAPGSLDHIEQRIEQMMVRLDRIESNISGLSSIRSRGRPAAVSQEVRVTLLSHLRAFRLTNDLSDCQPIPPYLKAHFARICSQYGVTRKAADKLERNNRSNCLIDRNLVQDFMFNLVKVDDESLDHSFIIQSFLAKNGDEVWEIALKSTQYWKVLYHYCSDDDYN